MTAGFVALAFSFCAGIISHHGQDLLALGYVSQGECIVKMEVGGNVGGTGTHVINGHDISIEIIEGGAVVGIDNLRFVIQRTEGI